MHAGLQRLHYPRLNDTMAQLVTCLSAKVEIWFAWEVKIQTLCYAVIFVIATDQCHQALIRDVNHRWFDWPLIIQKDLVILSAGSDIVLTGTFNRGNISVPLGERHIQCDLAQTILYQQCQIAVLCLEAEFSATPWTKYIGQNHWPFTSHWL